MSLKQRVTGDSIILTSPYAPDAPAAFRNCGGKWDAAAKAWVFPLAAQAAVDAAAKRIYGVTGRDEHGVPARITALKDVGARCDAIRFGGYVLASASGRDSGARTGQGVILENEKIDSGGSVKNWYTRIESGAVFLIEKFPEGVESTSDFKVEYLPAPATAGKPARDPRMAAFTDEEITAEARARSLI